MISVELERAQGIQTPRFSSAPDSVANLADEAIELMAQVGMPLDGWQQIALRLMLGERADGKWSAFEVAIIVARQNGKGGVLEARELAGLFLFGEQLIIHSAHQFDTSIEAFLRMKNLIDGSDFLRKRIARVSNSHGDEGFVLDTGQRLRYKARTSGGGRGFSGDLVILDEAQELSSRQLAALMPTLSARPNPQLIYTGTVNAQALVFRRLAERGRKGGDTHLAYAEWSAEEDADPTDPRVWAQANPALGLRIDLDYIAAEQASLPSEEFAQERLSIWPDVAALGSVIGVDAWAKCLDAGATFPGLPASLGIAISPDRDWSAVGAASIRPDGTTYVEVIQEGKGTDWLLPWLTSTDRAWEKCPQLIVDQAGPAGTMLVAFGAAGLSVRVTDYSAFKSACAGLVDAVKTNLLRHRGQEPLTAAANAVQEKRAGDSFVFARRSSTVIAPLEAVTLAFWGLSPDPKKKEFFMMNLSDYLPA